MQTAALPPAVVVFDPADTRKLANPFFGLLDVEAFARVWNAGFDAAYHAGAPCVPPAHLASRYRGEWIKGYAVGADARDAVQWEAEEARLADYVSTITHLPWGDDEPFGSEGDYAEARMAWPSTWALD